jgi:hypothetical protein
MKSPKFVALEITNRCQLQCKGCFSSSEDYPKGDMDPNFFYSVIDRMDPKTMTLNEYANGECLLHPKILDFVSYTIAKGIRNYITTNGMILNEDLFKLILTNPSQCYQLIFSLDGLWDNNSLSIEQCRPGSNRIQIKRTIERALEMKHKLSSATDVMVKICKRGQDWEEIEHYISYWLKYGADAVIVGELFTDFSTPGLRIYPCQYSDDQFMLIRWDQTARMCMYHPKVMNEGLLPIGKLDYTTPLLDFYNSPPYREFRDMQSHGYFPEPCKNCGISYTGSGIRGSIRFRNLALLQEKIYYRKDHYNEFWSLQDKGKPDSVYGHN